MQIYTPKDQELLFLKTDNIVEQAQRVKLGKIDPKIDTINNIMVIIRNFIKEKHRIVYGGTALNELLKKKNKSDAIYSEYDTPDLECYSYEPIDDLHALCNKLEDAGFAHVEGRQAQHNETYSVFVDFNQWADITYVPKFIYSSMPVIKMNGFDYIHPHFMMIDYYRMFNDPLSSYRLFSRMVKRFYKLQHAYPFEDTNKSLIIKSPSDKIKEMLSTVFDYLCDNKDVIVFGYYSYMHLFESSMLCNKKRNCAFDIPFYEVLAMDFNKVGNEIYKILREKFKDDKDKISIVEYYAFFQFHGHIASVMYGDKPLIYIYMSDNKCTPFQLIDAFSPITRKKINDKKIYLGTYQVIFMMTLILFMKAKIQKDKKEETNRGVMLSYLIQARNKYFKDNKKNILDDTPFKEFIVECMGDYIPPDRLFRLGIAQKKKERKRYIYTYDPKDSRQRNAEVTYKFRNTSGNMVRKIQNRKLILDK